MFSGGYLIAGLALHLDGILLFYLGYGVIGAAGIGLGYVTPVATVAKWHPDRKGLATGIVFMGFGVGAFLLSKVLAPLLVLRTEGDLPLVFAWLGVVFAGVLIPSSLILRNPPADFTAAPTNSPGDAEPENDSGSVALCLRSPEFTMMWLVFLFQHRCRDLGHQLSILTAAGCPGAGRVRGDADRRQLAVQRRRAAVLRIALGPDRPRPGFRILLASQMVVFGVLMTERDPWIFSALVCYVLFCFGGGFATMPSFVLDVFGAKRMSAIYGAVPTAWAAAGIFGPLYIGHLKDPYSDRAVIYCFLIGVLILGLGYVFSYLLNDDRVRPGRPTLKATLRQYGIRPPRWN